MELEATKQGKSACVAKGNNSDSFQNMSKKDNVAKQDNYLTVYFICDIMDNYIYLSIQNFNRNFRV